MNMVKNKMSLFFPDKEVIVSYETMMRLAGPYWFSILGVDYTGDILNPDYYLKFYTKNPS